MNSLILALSPKPLLPMSKILTPTQAYSLFNSHRVFNLKSDKPLTVQDSITYCLVRDSTGFVIPDYTQEKFQLFEPSATTIQMNPFELSLINYFQCAYNRHITDFSQSPKNLDLSASQITKDYLSTLCSTEDILKLDAEQYRQDFISIKPQIKEQFIDAIEYNTHNLLRNAAMAELDPRPIILFFKNNARIAIDLLDFMAEATLSIHFWKAFYAHQERVSEFSKFQTQSIEKIVASSKTNHGTVRVAIILAILMMSDFWYVSDFQMDKLIEIRKHIAQNTRT